MKTELNGKRIFFLGKLAGMSRREAEKLSRKLGAKVTGFLSDAVNLVIVGEAEYPGKNRSSITEKFDHLTRIAFENGNLEILTETDFWKRLNVEPQINLTEPLYTAAMIAELICVPLTTVRLWIQYQFLKPRQNVGKLLYFDFHELLAAKHLIQLFSTGLSLDFLRKRIGRFQVLFPEMKRIIPQLILAADGKDVYLRKDASLFDDNGQQYFDFDHLSESCSIVSYETDSEECENDFPSANADYSGVSSDFESVEKFSRNDKVERKDEFEKNVNFEKNNASAIIVDDNKINEFAKTENSSNSMETGKENKKSGTFSFLPHEKFDFSALFNESCETISKNDILAKDQRMFHRLMDQEIVHLCENAWKLEEEGKSNEAIELYRSALAFGGSDAGICFHLAGLLQRSGDIRAAKERYYMVIELDEDYVEARFQLGKILLELQEWEEAIAAFQGVLSYQPSDISSRIELGRLYLQQQCFAEAEEQFLLARPLAQDPKTIDWIDQSLLLCQKRSISSL